MIEALPLTAAQLAQQLPSVFRYAWPLVGLGVGLEWLATRHHHPRAAGRYERRDVLASVGIGLGTLLVNSLLHSLTLLVLLACHQAAPWRLPTTWWAWGLAYLGVDLSNYVAHYVAHKQRLWWATHVTHHSSEHLNLTTAFRNSWVQYLKIVFFIPLFLSGIEPLVLFTAYQLDLLYQFWIHTEAIGKLPRWVEFVFVMPSHHRVHHASNALYLDKNFGTTLILWDRLFGTFQAETEPPKYGLTKPVRSYNLVYLNFHEWAALGRDLRRARTLPQALKVLFGPP